MNKNLQRIIKRKKNSVLAMQRAIDFVENQLSHLEATDWVIFDDIQIKTQPGLKNLRHIRQGMGRGYKFKYSHADSDGDICHNYYHLETGIEITIRQDADLVDGMSCQRIKIGESVENIYQVVCGGDD